MGPRVQVPSSNCRGGLNRRALGLSPLPAPDWPAAGHWRIGAASGQSQSNGIRGRGSQSPRERGWLLRGVQSREWGLVQACIMPYVLISTQIRMVSTHRPAARG